MIGSPLLGRLLSWQNFSYSDPYRNLSYRPGHLKGLTVATRLFIVSLYQLNLCRLLAKRSYKAHAFHLRDYARTIMMTTSNSQRIDCGKGASCATVNNACACSEPVSSLSSSTSPATSKVVPGKTGDQADAVYNASDIETRSPDVPPSELDEDLSSELELLAPMLPQYWLVLCDGGWGGRVPAAAEVIEATNIYIQLLRRNLASLKVECERLGT